jgi:cell division protein FtsI/penicillin-binding protein 2
VSGWLGLPVQGAPDEPSPADPLSPPDRAGWDGISGSGPVDVPVGSGDELLPGQDAWVSGGETLAPLRSEEKPENRVGDGHIPAVPEPGPAPAAVRRRRGSSIFSWSRVVRVCVLLAVAGVIAAGLASGGVSAASAEPTVQSFLLAWEQGQYRTAASYTDGNQAAVAGALRTAYDQLDAAALYLTMGRITQTGDTATAAFGASVDLGEDGAPWTYTGWFPMHRTSAGWKIEWSLSDINPGLRPGTRLAVRTTLAPRGQVLDSAGQSLQRPSPAYVLGVQPAKLADPTATATALGVATGLDPGELLDQIRAGTLDSFLSLVTLDPSSYAAMSAQLAHIPGLVIHREMRRLFDSISSDVVGTVGTEVAPAFRQYGVAYQPGDTAGLSGLQQYYQRRLVGSPSTEVVVENSDGRLVSVLAKWLGPTGQPVRTTLSSTAQVAANDALATTGDAAAIIAIQSSTGKVLAVSSQPGRDGVTQPDPLNGHYPPGQAFTIVSAAALLDTGLPVDAPVPCTSASDVGGETFLNDPPAAGLGSEPSFGTDFTHGCGTAFAGLSRRLSPGGLFTAASSFGLGMSWRLPLTAYSGTMPTPGDDAAMAADTIGTGAVQVSPLDMALIAAQVDSGAWHAPSLVTSPSDPSDPPLTAKEISTSKAALSPQVMNTLRGLMRATVQTGAGRQADLAGSPVYGQAGQAPYVQGGKDVQAFWFVGYRGGVAFAVLELAKSTSGSAVPLAAQFLQRLPASLLGQ